jgi:hypothetical protein
MSKIHIARDRQLLGHFYPAEVALGLRTGRFLPTDLGWQDPMETWKPLSEFADLPVVESSGPPPLPQEEPAPVEVEEPAWERRQTEGMVSSFLKTISQVFSQPVTTFRALQPGKPGGAALAYFLLLATGATWVMLAYQLVFLLMVPDVLKAQWGGRVTLPMLVAATVFNMLFTPFFLAGLAMIFSGIAHLLLTLLGVVRPAFAMTLRAFCYAVGTAYICLLVPICGPLVFVPCAVVYLVIALKEAHRIDAFRSLAAVMIPVVLLAVGYLVLLAQAGMLKN